MPSLKNTIASMSAAWRSRFGEVVWARQSAKEPFWPSYIYDPRHELIRDNSALARVDKFAKGVYIVYFFGYEKEPIADPGNCSIYGFSAESNILGWQEGIDSGCSNIANIKSKKAVKFFPGAVEAATFVSTEPKERRLSWRMNPPDMETPLDDLDEDIDDLKCDMCGSPHSTKKDPMLICEQCEKGFHKACLSVKRMPNVGVDWYCSACRPPVIKTSGKRRVSKTNKESNVVATVDAATAGKDANMSDIFGPSSDEGSSGRADSESGGDSENDSENDSDSDSDSGGDKDSDSDEDIPKKRPFKAPINAAPAATEPLPKKTKIEVQKSRPKSKEGSEQIRPVSKSVEAKTLAASKVESKPEPAPVDLTPEQQVRQDVMRLERFCGLRRHKNDKGALVFRQDPSGLNKGEAVRCLNKFQSSLATRELYNYSGARFLLVELTKESFFNDDIRLAARSVLQHLNARYPPLVKPKPVIHAKTDSSGTLSSNTLASSHSALKTANSSMDLSSGNSLASLLSKKAPTIKGANAPLAQGPSPGVSSGMGSEASTLRGSVGAAPESICPRDSWDWKECPEDVLSSTLRLNHVRFLHSTALHNMSAAIRLEAAVWRNFAEEKVRSGHCFGYTSHENASNSAAFYNNNYNDTYSEYIRVCTELGCDLVDNRRGLRSLLPRIICSDHQSALELDLLCRTPNSSLEALR